MTRDEFVSELDRLVWTEGRRGHHEALEAWDAQAAEVERLLRAINLAAETESGNAKVLIAVSRRAEKAESALSAMTAERDNLQAAWDGALRDVSDRAGIIDRLSQERDEAEARGLRRGLEVAAGVCETAADVDASTNTARSARIRALAAKIRSLLPAAPSTKEGEP